MLITRETDYALRILRRLSQGGTFTVGELADKDFLPQQFAYKIIKKLEKAEFVKIIRGVDGGCRLDSDLSQKTLYELVIAVEKNARLSACMSPEHKCEWRHNNKGMCTVHNQLARIQQSIDKELRSRSINWVLFGE